MTIFHLDRDRPGLAQPLPPSTLTVETEEGQTISLPSVPFSNRSDQAPYVLLAGACSSALDLAWKLMEAEDFPEWSSVLCVSQWAGRGQFRRPWASPEGNLHAAWRWPYPPENWQRIVPLLAGACIRSALDTLGFAVTIKWPNDLLQHGSKVGGILVEERQNCLLVGVGLNLTARPHAQERRDNAFPPETLEGPALPEPAAPGLWAALVPRCRDCYSSLLGCTPRSFLNDLQADMAFIGQEALVDSSGRRLRGVVSGLNDDGSLLLRRGEALVVLNSGSILPLDPATDS